jgi:hypothetical protein
MVRGEYVRHKRHKSSQGMLAGSRGETVRRNNVRGKLPFVYPGLAPENKRGAQIQSGSNPRAFRIGTEKRRSIPLSGEYVHILAVEPTPPGLLLRYRHARTHVLPRFRRSSIAGQRAAVAHGTNRLVAF